METLLILACIFAGSALASTPWVEKFSKRVEEKVLEGLRSQH